MMEVHGKCKLETHASCSVCKKRGMRSLSAKNRASCALRCPKCQARISFALLSIPRSSKRLLTGLFPATLGSSLKYRHPALKGFDFDSFLLLVLRADCVSCAWTGRAF